MIIFALINFLLPFRFFFWERIPSTSKFIIIIPATLNKH